ncbi:MAG TPA: FecR family protein [Vineibacter sp.]|nr:FecR family protein [Vineibacter sp.]
MTPEQPDTTTAAAQRWFVLLRDQDASEADRAAFARWLADDPANQAAWERTQRLWSRLDDLTPHLRHRLHAEIGNRGHAPAMSGPATGRSRRAWLQGAAAAALVVAGGGYALTVPGPFADYRTRTAERRTVTLPDGSTMELGSNTAVSLAFDSDIRRLVLHAGEAFFQVAADARRPFIVAADRGATRALGTAFNIKRQADAVTVSVIEHAVAVSVDGQPAVTVGQGQQVRYDHRRLDAVRAADVADVQAWRRDRLVFRDSPLRAVIADLERYRSGRIVITDDRIARIPVTGVFHARQTDAALATIADTLPVRVTRASDLLVFIRPR